MPEEVGNLVAKLGLDDTQFGRGINRAQANLRELSSAVKPVAAASAAAFAGMGAAIAGVVKIADEQTRAELKLASAIKGTGQAINAERIHAYAAALQRVTTFGDEATIGAAAMLTTFQLNEDQIIGLLPKVQNLAALYGMDLNQAALTVGRALTAGAGALSRYGISMSEAEKAAFNAGTQTEKVALLMHLLDKNTGPAAETLAKTATGAFTMLTNQAGDLAEQFGFIVRSPIRDWLLRLTGAIGKITDMVAGLSDEQKDWAMKIALGTVAVTGLVAALSGIAVALPFLTTGFAMMGTAAVTAFSVVLLPAIALGAAIIGAIAAVGALKRAWDANLTIMGKSMKEWAEEFRMLWVDLVNWFSDIWEKATKWIGETAITAFAMIKGLSPEETYQLTKAFERSFEESGVGESLEFAFQGGKEILSSAWDDLKKSFEAGAELIKGAASDAGIDIGGTIDEVLAKAEGLFRLPAGAAPGALPPGAPGGPADAAGGAGDAARNTAREFDTVSNSLNMLAAASGEVGSIASGTAQAFMAGGPVAGFVTLALELVTRTESFGRIVESLNRILGAVLPVVSKLIEGLEPLITTVAILAELILGRLQPVMAFLGNVLDVVARVIAAIMIVIVGIFWALGEAWNALITNVIGAFIGWLERQIERVAGWFGSDLDLGWGDAINNAVVNTDNLANAMDDLTAVVMGRTDTEAEAAEQTATANPELSTFGDNLQSINEELTNIPEGFKIAAARFDAAFGEAFFDPDTLTPKVVAGIGGGGAGVVIENVTVNAGGASGSEVADNLQSEEFWDWAASGNDTGQETQPPASGRSEVR